MNYTILFFLAGVIYVLTGIHTLTKDRNSSQNKLYFSLAMLFTFWAFVNASLFLVTDPHIAANTRRYSALSWGVIYSVVLHLVLIVSGYIKKMNTRILYPVLYGPSLVNIYLYFFNPYQAHEMVLTKYGWGVIDYYRNNFLWDHYFTIYYSVCILLSLALLTFWYLKTDIRREKKQATIVFHTLLFVAVVGTILEVILPIFGITLVYGSTVLVSLVPVMGIWYSIERYGLMNFNLKNLSYEIIDMMDEGFIVCDAKGNIINYNRGGDLLINGNCEHKIKNIYDLKLTTPYQSMDAMDDALEFINGDGKTIRVLANNMPILDSVGDLTGYLILAQDITKLYNTQKKLEDLNRELEDKVSERTKALSIANQTLKSEILIRKRAEDRNKSMAFTDNLTGLPNGRHLKKVIDDKVAFQEMKTSFILLFFDLDDFKTINDTKGHGYGDALLISIANRLNRHLDDSHFIARKGGDEFYIVVNTVINNITPEEIAEEIKAKLNEPFSIQNQMVSIESSIGLCEYPKHGSSYQELMKYVDIAMYKAKAKGKNTYEIFTDQMYKELEFNQSLIGEFDRALENDEFILHFQPQIDTNTNLLDGVEALVRWQHPELGLLYPGSFIALAEESGYINPLGRWVVKNAFKTLMRWKNTSLENINLAVNLSVLQLHDDELVSFVEECKETYDVNMNQVHFEITESIFLNNDDLQIKTIKELYNLGINIVIDDFGIEYSTLNYLKKLPLSIIKIDKSFIDGINQNKIDEAIIKAFIKLSMELNLGIIAEGVETESQVDFLNQMGCTHHQGYYYSRPMDEYKLLNKFNIAKSEVLEIEKTD